MDTNKTSTTNEPKIKQTAREAFEEIHLHAHQLKNEAFWIEPEEGKSDHFGYRNCNESAMFL